MLIVALILCTLVSSCSSNRGNSNSTMDTQFSVTVHDSIHLLSPKTYSYLKNINPPLGLVPVIVTVDSIADSEMGTFADNQFDEYCDKDYIGGTFEQRGVLLVVSDNPKLIQVRVGDTYSVYCRMRGSSAGRGYLDMQNSVKERGLDEMCPIALSNVIADIEECRSMPFYKKAFFKMSLFHIDTFLENLATPSESFFNQIYFRPFVYVVSVIHGLVGSWWLAFFVICFIYLAVKKWINNRVHVMLKRRAQRDASSNDDVLENMLGYEFIKMLFAMILKFVVAFPTFGAISVLSTSRMEDVIVLKYYNIPYVDIIGDSMLWENSAPVLWTILLLMLLYYFITVR